MTPDIREIDNRSPDQRSERERFLEERVRVLQEEVRHQHELNVSLLDDVKRMERYLNR